MKNWKKIILIVFTAMIVYSFLPIVPFIFMKGADNAENNEKAASGLKGNKGRYFSFIVFGDNHAGLVFNDASAMKLIWHMNREDRFAKVPIDFALNLGDVTLDGKKGHYRSYKKIQKLIKWPLISMMGNHDNEALFREYCGEKEFSFSDRDCFFIVLDNEDGRIDEARFSWLEEELAEGSAFGHIFVMMHKPPFEPYQQDWYNVEAKPWACRFRKLCEKYGVKMVFSGHRHMTKSERLGGVEYVVSGGGGMLIEIPESEGGCLHYVRVLVAGDDISYEVRKVSPPAWEYPVYYLWKEFAYWARNFYGSGYIFGRNTEVKKLREDINDG